MKPERPGDEVAIQVISWIATLVPWAISPVAIVVYTTSDAEVLGRMLQVGRPAFTFPEEI